MFKSKLAAGLTSAAVIAATVAVAPAVNAMELEIEQRNGKDICVAALSDIELEETKEYFRLLISSHLELQEKLRALYPDHSATFEEIDARQAAGESLTIYRVSRELSAQLAEDGFTGLEMEQFIWKHSEQHRVYQDFAQNGYPVHAEVAADWSRVELVNYPFGAVPVLRVGADWSYLDTRNSVSAAFGAQPYIPLSVFRYVTSYSWSNSFRPIYEPIDIRFDAPSNAFNALVGRDTFEQAADECLEIVRDRKVVETPTTDPSTLPETTVPGEPSTDPEPSDEKPAPTTVTEPGETVTETAEPTTVTMIPTVTETAEPSPTPEPADEKNGEGSSSLPTLGIFAAIIAALGGVLAFLAPQLEIFTSLLP